ncbi:uncharacterized protein MYCFIDRAFT_177087 [Pseudocercospora fijiensis CIRAD86]|uniref:Uncharacterized protein n=1 Tax=Pseudocercospora fijiensis (strain CIRAD86) TaxID=383855 RepID=M2ZM15_PSEFD|nr:uncharacterized protein MYCFIDRAFT_177087 [Pseudocercospora fijiensis CIRAD86]EME80109.1 hypothetical protein MYCFIDRAFT_177087 [Pseudocercospora fijiensis CIRAD86]
MSNVHEFDTCKVLRARLPEMTSGEHMYPPNMRHHQPRLQPTPPQLETKISLLLSSFLSANPTRSAQQARDPTPAFNFDARRGPIPVIPASIAAVNFASCEPLTLTTVAERASVAHPRGNATSTALEPGATHKSPNDLTSLLGTSVRVPWQIPAVRNRHGGNTITTQLAHSADLGFSYSRWHYKYNYLSLSFFLALSNTKHHQYPSMPANMTRREQVTILDRQSLVGPRSTSKPRASDLTSFSSISAPRPLSHELHNNPAKDQQEPKQHSSSHYIDPSTCSLACDVNHFALQRMARVARGLAMHNEEYSELAKKYEHLDLIPTNVRD